MPPRKILAYGLRIFVVCLLFAVCFVTGGALSRVAKFAQQGPAIQATPMEILLPVLAFSFCVGIVVSYLILRSSWRGLMLVGTLFAAMYGISTVATQVESIFFLSAKLPHGMIRALFVQGAIALALFAPLAVLVLGKWKAVTPTAANPASDRLSASSTAWRISLLVVAFIFLYMFFGYYVAWQNPALRQYYGGPELSSFYAALQSNWVNVPWIYPLQVFRALLFVACVLPLIRMLRVTRWERAAAAALFLSAWTTILWLPNPLMPASVARTHFWETLAFSLTFGALLGWLLGKTATSRKSAADVP